MFTIGVKGSIEEGTSTTSKQRKDRETLERGSGDEDWQLVQDLYEKRVMYDVYTRHGAVDSACEQFEENIF